MELRITNINNMLYDKIRPAFKKFINDEFESNFDTTVILRADEILISYSRDEYASDILNVRLYTRSLSAGVKGFTGFFQLESADFFEVSIM